MGEKTVKEGETVSEYARKSGLTAKTIWRQDQNRELRERREDPNVLYPGDKIYIPEVQSKQESASTEQRHRFRKLGSLEVRIAVLDLHHEPLPDIEYHFVVDGEEREQASTDDQGMATTHIFSPTCEVLLHLPWGEFPLKLGYLDPARTVKGTQQRLRNLGIAPGPIDGIMGPKTARAIREFQEAEAGAGLRLTGEPDEQTIKRLRQVHDKQTLEGVHNTRESHDPTSSGGLPDDEVDSEISEVEGEDEVDELGAYDGIPENSENPRGSRD